MVNRPTFSRGHCFMAETLNRPEVEAVGPLVAAAIAAAEAAGEDARHLRRALRKMDYPEPDPATAPAVGPFGPSSCQTCGAALVYKDSYHEFCAKGHARVFGVGNA